MFNVLCSDKILNCAENHASPEQFLRVIWEAGFWAIVLTLAPIKLFSILTIDYLLIIFIDRKNLNDIVKVYLKPVYLRILGAADQAFPLILSKSLWFPSAVALSQGKFVGLGLVQQQANEIALLASGFYHFPESLGSHRGGEWKW